MSGLGLGGLISGMSTDDIIKKIMDFESVGVTNQQIKKLTIQEKQAAWSRVRGSLETLRTKLDAVRFPSAFKGRKATLTDAAVASVTAATGATLTSHSLTVSTLAQAHVVAGNSTQPSANAALSQSGTLTINNQNITVVATDTLNSLRDKINATANTNVIADVVKVMNGTATAYRLVLTSKNQGVAGAVQMTSSALTQALGFHTAAGAWANELAAAQDATFKLDGVNYTKSTNVIADLLPNLTITLLKGGNVSTNFTVDQDVDSVVNAVQGWVDQLNQTLAQLKTETDYNDKMKTAGTLNGDSLARRLQTSLRGMLSNMVAGLPTDLNQMAHVGVTSGKWGTTDYGKVMFDPAKLKAQLLKDPEGAAKVFGAMRNNVALGAAATATSTDTTNGTFSPADVVNGDTDSARFGSAGGGWQSAGVPSTAVPEQLTIAFASTRTIDQIRLWQPDTATYQASATGLQNYSLEYQGTDNAWHPLSTVTNQQGPSKLLDFTAVQARAVRLNVTATYGTNNPARVTEFEVNEVNNGTAIDMYRYVRDSLTTSTGPLDTRNVTYNKQIKDIDTSITRMTANLTKREETLRLQFTRMEQAMARLNSQGSALAQMSGMPLGK